MNITFLYPDAGWLLLLLPLVWWAAGRRPALGHLALRCAVFVALILALMQPVFVRRARAGAQVVVLDQRAALGAAGRTAARGALARVMDRAPRDGSRTLIQLGGTPVDAPVDTREQVTDDSLSTALARALAATPLAGEGSLTLITDERSTDRHWEGSLAAIARRGIPVNSVAIPPATRPAFVSDVQAHSARVGELVQVEVKVEGDGGVHRVALWSGDRQLADSGAFRVDGTTQVALRFPATRAGFVPLRAVLDGRRRFDSVAAVQPPLSLLYVGGDISGAAKLRRLLGSGVTIEARTPAGLAGAGDLARWPVLFLDDVPAASLSASVQQRIARAVARDGTGLMMTGGEAAFGSGGYASTPLAATLPVTASPGEIQEKPSVALAIVVDSSGSMSGKPLDLAKQIARQTVRKLDAADWVGVVEFYGAKQWAVPMQHARDTQAVERAIGRMQAQGASMLFPALQEAYYGLKDVDARYKHILVISDGGVAEDRYQQLVRHIADARINLSTAIVGAEPEGEQAMADWARLGRGRFYSVPDELSLVELDFKQPQTRPASDYRAGAVGAHAVPAAMRWQGIEPVSIPPLAGYVRVRLRPEAEALVLTGGGDPLLGTWQSGRGRVTALMTEPLGEGSRPWRGWTDYGRWLARVVATTARQRPAIEATVARRFDQLAITVQRREPTGNQAPVARLLAEDGRTPGSVVHLEARAPGIFVASVPFPAGMPALVEVRDGDAVARVADRAYSDRSPADAIPAAATLPLADLAARSGGWHRDADTRPGPLQRGGGWVAVDLWPWLSLLTLILYVTDIAYRRRPRRRYAEGR